MDILGLAAANLLSPPILFFALGLGAGLVKSDLDVPESISRYLSIYLMMAIGFKGGTALASVDALDWTMAYVMAAALAFSALAPFPAFLALRALSRLDAPTAAAVAAHYGSVSLVTFVTAVSFLEANGVPYQGYMPAVLALMEAPAILTGLYIAHRAAPETIAVGDRTAGRLNREIFTNGAIMLLMGSFVIGLLTGESGAEKLGGFLVTPFQGVLSLFLLDLGLLVARQRGNMGALTAGLLAFGVVWPLLSASAALAVAYAIGLDPGTGLLFVVLAASASYIAVPAAMRLALPQARAAIYVPLSLGVTFPFNIVAGVPLYYAAAQAVLGS
ncbi:MAG: sodium-dependent bicarbonate transport family permease [Hyphomicrobiales bacterium]|nr:sodium-dependent bicarbonate transport family permease [Hyphomicrobiales bacterium]